MGDADYGVWSVADGPWTQRHAGVERAALTDELGARETRVDASRLEAHASITPDGPPEQLLIVIDGTLELGTDGPAVEAPALVRVPPGKALPVHAGTSSLLIGISVAADPEPAATPTPVDLETASYTVPSTSDIATAFLTGPLGLTGMKANARRLDPGQVVPYHTEGTQEELFVPVRGPASLRVDGQSHELATGSVGRVAPDVPRSAVNDGETDALWVMVGAPPTGGPTDWDPGAEILE